MFTRYRFALALIALCLLSACGSPAAESGTTSGALTISRVWMRTPLPGVDTDAIYMTITNTGASDDTLIGVQCDVASSVEIHATTNTNGVMAMRPVETIAVPAQSSVALEAGMYHVMLVGRTREVQRGELVPVELQFQHAGRITVQAEVRDRPLPTTN